MSQVLIAANGPERRNLAERSPAVAARWSRGVSRRDLILNKHRSGVVANTIDVRHVAINHGGEVRVAPRGIRRIFHHSPGPSTRMPARRGRIGHD